MIHLFIEDVLKSLPIEVQVIKNNLKGPSIDLDLLIEEVKYKEKGLGLEDRLSLWKGLLEKALMIQSEDIKSYCYKDY